jgi:leucyl aminopeptidase (aminopeptidase T)
MASSLASLIVNNCLRVKEKDNVSVFFYPHSLSLAEEISKECFKNGADVLLNIYTDKFYEDYMNLLSVESLKEPSVFCRTLTENSTVQIWMGGVYDPKIFSKLSPEKEVAAHEGESKAHFPMARERKVRGLEVGFSLVTRPRAKAYGFDFAKWKSMMNASSNVDYSKLAEVGRALRRDLEGASSIVVTAPNGTDLKFDVSGRKWRVSDGVIDDRDIQEETLDDEIPAGSISVSPIEESANGTITFNTKTPSNGVPIRKMTWKFSDGRLSEFLSEKNARIIRELYDNASGDKDKISYFAIGFNPKALTGFTINTIASGAVSVGIGGNEEMGGNNRSSFGFVHTLTGATVTANGRTILKNGKLAEPYRI